MNTNLKIDGVMVLTGAAIIAALGVAYLVKKKGASVVDAINPASDKNLAYSGVNAVGTWFSGNPNWSLGSAAYEWINEDIPAFLNPTPPGVSVVDSSGKTVASVSGSSIKKANANPTNMGMIAWPASSAANVSPWYTGYQMEDWEKDNPFGDAPSSGGGTWLYTGDSPLGKAVDWIGSLFKPDYSEIINDGVKGNW